jgi:hypothetical protein
MKRCPKCSRTFPDDNQKFCTIDGGLLIAEQAFDPNATFRASAPLTPASTSPPATPPVAPQPPTQPSSSGQPDFGATIATSSSAPTAVLPKHTAPTGARTIVDQSAPPAPSAPLPQQRSAPLPQDTPSIPIPPPRTEKKSKMPLIVGILLLLLVLGVGAVAAVFFLVIKPRLNEVRPAEPVATSPTKDENTNSNTSVAVEEPKTEPEFVAPPNTVKFTNSQANLDGKLAEHYLDFSFYYPKEWQTDPKAGTPGASNFAKFERRLPPDFTQENFAVGWYTSKGTFAADEATFSQLVQGLSNTLANGFPEYQKVSEGPTKVNSLDGYEFRFTSISKGTEKGDLKVWGRVIFLPTGVAGDQTGATLIMLATSLAPELSNVDDVGAQGETPVILESFRFGKKP